MSLTISRYKGGRHWAVREAETGSLVVVTVYRKGAAEVVGVEILTIVSPSPRVTYGCLSSSTQSVALVQEGAVVDRGHCAIKNARWSAQGSFAFLSAINGWMLKVYGRVCASLRP